MRSRPSQPPTGGLDVDVEPVLTPTKTTPASQRTPTTNDCTQASHPSKSTPQEFDRYLGDWKKPKMVLSTLLARISDGLPLAASVDDEQTENDLSEYRQQAKLIFRRLNETSETRCSIESGKYTLHYVISNSVVYLCIAAKSYPRKLAFSYLDELSKEFERSYSSELSKPNLRPYAFVKFDTFIQRTKKLYQDTRTQSNLDRLNEDLGEVTRVMTKNMEDLLWRGDSLDRMSTMSSSLKDESLKYRKAARQINIDAFYRKWAPVGVIGIMFLFVVWWRFW
ncbi:vesicle transporter SEC22 [Puccinia sorghi]|uniref:Protein transport protein SEC22 n=1 Tax=Puccinia sorghi TaxID=27349 RepID=A0A0L6V8I1_9BASI|nr:vesicle transporter SEC22 [Puccinia sorghi]